MWRFRSCTQHRSFVALVLLPRDAVQGKLENLGQVLYLSNRHLSFFLNHDWRHELSWTKEATILFLFCQFIQMLDGQENTLDVSQIDCRPSPSKQRKALDGLGPSPSKQQKTLDGFLKRPSTSTSTEEGMPSPSTKQPRRIWGSEGRHQIKARVGHDFMLSCRSCLD